jgi:DNA repair protein RadD
MTELRDYQNNAVERLEQTTKALYVLPTGGGKTIVATNLIERAVQRGERVLVLTHRREILQQTSLKLPIEHGLILAGLNIDLELPVQIASVQTLWARCMRTDKVRLPAANLIVIDEAHHVAAHTWQAIVAEYPNARLIGLSATPCRGDGRGLGNFFDELIVGPQIPELIAAKHLVPTIYYAPAEPDLGGVETRQGDYVVNQLADRAAGSICPTCCFADYIRVYPPARAPIGKLPGSGAAPRAAGRAVHNAVWPWAGSGSSSGSPPVPTDRVK